MKKTSSIRTRSMVTIALFSLAIIAIVFFVMRVFAYESASELDRNQGVLQVQRVHDSFSFIAAAMEQTAADWSKWDETYQYVAGTNPEFIENNLYLEALESIQMNIALVFDIEANLLYGQQFDFKNSTSQAISESLLQEIQFILDTSDPLDETQVSGLVSLLGRLYIMVSSAILPSDYSGPSNGTLVFLREVDEPMISSIEAIIGVPFQIIFNETLDESNPIEIDLDDYTTMHIQGLVHDFMHSNTFAIEMQVVMVTTVIIYQTLRIVTWLLVITFLVFLFLMIWTLDQQLFRRISKITTDIQELNQSNNLSLRITTNVGTDEINYIGNEINSLLDKLEHSYQEIQKLAMTDHLTNTHNRLSFYQEMDAMIQKHDTSFAILLFDIDRFKEVNDHFGHDVGDDVLIEVAKRVNQSIQPHGILARTGGDEFLIGYPRVDSQSLKTLHENIIHSISQPMLIEGSTLNISVSIGVSIFPTHGSTMKELVKKADIAMYESKRLGKNQCQFYQEMLKNSQY